MPVRRTIGVDMGGTKLLAGAVGPDLSVHSRAQRTVAGLDQATLINTAVDAVEEARDSAGGDVEAVCFGIPSLIDQRKGIAVIAINLPLADIAFADVMAERLGLPVVVDNDANMAMLAEHRAGAARGSREAVMMTLGTGIGGGLVLGGELYRGAIGAGAELGHVVIDMDGPRCQGNCPNHGCVESLASGTALAREARRIAAERPASGLGRAVADGREPAGPLVTELAHDGDPAAIEVLALIGTRLGVAIASFVNIFNPEVVVIGGGVIGAGEFLLAPARAEMRQRALIPSRDEVRIVAARFGVEAGMIGAAALAFDHLEGRSGRVSGRLIVCPTPIGNLEDITLRALAALRDADVVACEDTRRTRVLLDRYGVRAKLLSYHEHNEVERSAELVKQMRAGTVVALVSDAGMPLVSDPGFVLVRACVAAGLAVEVLPGPSAALAALVASALPADRWRFAGFLPRKKGELAGVFAATETLVAFESPRRVAGSLAVLAAVDPERPVAVCRELTKVHEEVVRGKAADLAARYAAEPPKGEVVLVVGPAAKTAGDLERGLEAVRRLVNAGAKPRVAASVVAELTGTSANALYKALTADD